MKKLWKVIKSYQKVIKTHLNDARHSGNDRYRKVCSLKRQVPKGILNPMANKVDMIIEWIQKGFRWVVLLAILKLQATTKVRVGQSLSSAWRLSTRWCWRWLQLRLLCWTWGVLWQKHQKKFQPNHKLLPQEATVKRKFRSRHRSWRTRKQQHQRLTRSQRSASLVRPKKNLSRQLRKQSEWPKVTEVKKKTDGMGQRLGDAFYSVGKDNIWKR